MNPTIITGWIAAVLLFFAFSTCLAMPWSRKKVEECDGKHCAEHPLCDYHRPAVFLSILAMIAHIVVAIIT